MSESTIDARSSTALRLQARLESLWPGGPHGIGVLHCNCGVLSRDYVVCRTCGFDRWNGKHLTTCGFCGDSRPRVERMSR